MSELIDFFKVEAAFDPATSSTREVVQTSDPAQFRRQVTVVKKWTRLAELGRGTSATVWLEHDEESKESRAVKQISKSTPSNPFVGTPKRELLALSKLSKRQDLFVHFHGWFEDQKSVFLAMEYFELGNLENYITPELTENDAKMIGRQLLEGLQVLNGYGMAHRDLKPANIFVARDAPNWWIKIGDFGFSRYITAKQNSILSLVGTPNYMAPEILLGSDEEDHSSYTLAVDIWSLGCVIFRLLTRHLPFPQNKGLRLYWFSKTLFPANILIENQVSEDGVSLVSEMMKSNPANRITVATALHHPWFFIQESRPMPRCQNSHEEYREEAPEEEPEIEQAPIQPYTSVPFDGDGIILEDNLLSRGAIIPSSASDTSLPNESLKDLRNGDAEHLETQRIEAQRPILRDKDFDPHLSTENLTNPYRKPRRHRDRVQSDQDTLENQKRTFGKEHRHTLHSMSKLAKSYRSHHRYQEAIQLDQEALEIRVRILGEAHPNTLHSKSTLASFYRGLCRYQEAMQLDQQTLEARRRILGEEHPNTLRSMSYLASSYIGLHRYQEAMQLDQQALEAQRRILGEEHPDTLRSMNSLASSYRGLHQYRKAIQLVQEALEIQVRILGKEHPATLRSMSYLANSYRGLRRYQKAMQLNQQTLEVRRRILGEEHLDTLRSMHILASSYRELRRYQEAIQLE
ncbi:hypothetical protein MMC31_003326 [Peltigera leucophlebia]|nr:hypothetical protein [Peltigera leucophlebia]